MSADVVFKVESHEFLLRQDIKTVALYNGVSEQVSRRCIVTFVENGSPLPPPYNTVDSQGNITDGALFFSSEFIPVFLDMLRNERIWVGLSENPELNSIATRNWQGTSMEGNGC